MSDDKNKMDFRDRTRINVNQDYEARYWSERFGVSVEQLRQAVEATGSEDVNTIEAYFQRGGNSGRRF